LNKKNFNMVHVRFDTADIGFDDFIQSGEGLIGMESPDMPVYSYFKGSPPFQRGFGHQTGAGIGDIFRGLWRFFLPLLRRAGTAASSEALNAGQRVLEKVSHGEPLKSSLVSEVKKGADNLLERGGLPKQFGTGRRRGIKRKLPSHQTIIGPPPTPKPIIQAQKRIRSDAFGLY
jgi:hypothetical protein